MLAATYRRMKAEEIARAIIRHRLQAARVRAHLETCVHCQARLRDAHNGGFMELLQQHATEGPLQ